VGFLCVFCLHNTRGQYLASSEDFTCLYNSDDNDDEEDGGNIIYFIIIILLYYNYNYNYNIQYYNNNYFLPLVLRSQGSLKID